MMMSWIFLWWVLTFFLSRCFIFFSCIFNHTWTKFLMVQICCAFEEPSLNILENMLMIYICMHFTCFEISVLLFFINFLNYSNCLAIKLLELACRSLCDLTIPLVTIFRVFDLMDLRKQFHASNSFLEKFESKLPTTFLIVMRRTLLLFRLSVVVSFQMYLYWWLK
jgi:hypothetical protein